MRTEQVVQRRSEAELVGRPLPVEVEDGARADLGLRLIAVRHIASVRRARRHVAGPLSLVACAVRHVSARNGARNGAVVRRRCRIVPADERVVLVMRA